MSTLDSLPAELSLAIRTHHLQLNRLITNRLALCLPPHTSNLRLYASGMTVVSHIYAAIEDALLTLVERKELDERLAHILQTLQTQGLPRSHRLLQDLEAMKSNLDAQAVRQIEDLSAETQEKLYTDIHRKLLCGPHLILAWSWAMYLATFNGGRYIRQVLSNGGDDFWNGEPSLSFWEFNGDLDGDDVKDDFKRKFEVASRSLTGRERAEVVKEVDNVLDTCEDLVRVLDDWIGTRDEDKVENKPKATTATIIAKTAVTDATFLVMVLAMLAGIWQALPGALSSLKRLIRPAIHTTLEAKELHIE